ncbi:hypothetical protein [Actinoallomurus sp. CA-142502]|uniref:hypothetical protein n=1 Tax=Actinoallomurus sp. CA-142502 TaxID=3239885 RepID=UPI003D910EDB
MNVDRTPDDSDASPETTGEKPDRPAPPPPDKPGADGCPSRADSRLGATAANDALVSDDKSLRESLDPAGAEGGSNVIGDARPDPTDRTGDRIAGPGSDKDSRLERLRKRGYEGGRDALESAGKATDRALDLLMRHPPSGHAETRTGPTMTEVPHHGIETGNALAAAMMASVLFGEGIRRLRGRTTHTKGA